MRNQTFTIPTAEIEGSLVNRISKCSSTAVSVIDLEKLINYLADCFFLKTSTYYDAVEYLKSFGIPPLRAKSVVDDTLTHLHSVFQGVTEFWLPSMQFNYSRIHNGLIVMAYIVEPKEEKEPLPVFDESDAYIPIRLRQ